jgi:carbamoyl-phosphate synthase large subunit
MLGESLPDVRSLIPVLPTRHVAVKAPVFPFNKFKGADPKLGPEMKSTGEVMGIDEDFPRAFAKAQSAANNKLPLSGNVFISVNNFDKPRALEVARRYAALGFKLLATEGSADYFRKAGLAVEAIRKKHEGSPHVEELIRQGAIHLVINTPIGEEALIDDSYIRKAAVECQVPLVTTMDGAQAMADAVASLEQQDFKVRSLQSFLGADSILELT